MLEETGDFLACWPKLGTDVVFIYCVAGLDEADGYYWPNFGICVALVVVGLVAAWNFGAKAVDELAFLLLKRLTVGLLNDVAFTLLDVAAALLDIVNFGGEVFYGLNCGAYYVGLFDYYYN